MLPLDAGRRAQAQGDFLVVLNGVGGRVREESLGCYVGVKSL